MANRSGSDNSGNKMAGSCSPRKAASSKGMPKAKSKDSGSTTKKNPARQY